MEGTDPCGRGGGGGGCGDSRGWTSREGAVVRAACVVGRLAHGAHGTLLLIAAASALLGFGS